MRATRLLASLILAAAARDSASAEQQIAAVLPPEVSAWDARIEAMVRGGELRARQYRADPTVPGRRHQRLAQLHDDVPVFGGEIVRQADEGGAVSIFGTLYEGIAVETRPALSADQARSAL